MDLEKLKEYLQNYLDTVVSLKVNEKRNLIDLPEIKFDVFQVLKGSYQPPMFHVFLDTEPEIRKKSGLKPHTIMMMDGIKKDIEDFLKIFSINNKVIVHWNKRPIFKDGTIHTEN